MRKARSLFRVVGGRCIRSPRVVREFTQRNECSSVDSLLGRERERRVGEREEREEEEEEAGLCEWYHIILFRKFGHTPLLWEIANSSIPCVKELAVRISFCDPSVHSESVMVKLLAFPHIPGSLVE